MRGDGASSGGRGIVLVHSSDLHIDDDFVPGHYNGLEGLRFVLKGAEDARADVVLLAGDTFDNPRVSESMARRAGEMLAAAPIPVVVLPGNHDPAMPDGIYHRTGLTASGPAMVIGHTHEERIFLPLLDLEILGRPHTSYFDMPPLPTLTERQARWQVIVAHGHFVPPEDWASEAHRSWKISEADLAAVTADYVALGHWDRPVAVGNDRVRAYYSGSPDLAQTVNVVHLDPMSGVSVERRPLGMPYPRRW